MNLEHDLERELSSGERLLWSGAPRHGLRLQASDVFLVPFSLMWGGIAFYWEYTVIGQDAPLLFRLVGVPFVLIGIHLIVGRFIFDAKRRAETIYGLTDQRVLIVTRFPMRKTQSISLASLGHITFFENDDRSGTLTLGTPVSSAYSWLSGSGWPGLDRYLPPCLVAIDDVRDVHDQLLRAIDNVARGHGVSGVGQRMERQ